MAGRDVFNKSLAQVVPLHSDSGHCTKFLECLCWTIANRPGCVDSGHGCRIFGRGDA